MALKRFVSPQISWYWPPPTSDSLTITYSKRRESILKKSADLATICDADVAVLIFSPTGRLTTFANQGRVEDIFLRYLEQPDYFKGPDDRNEILYQSLKHLKCEAEMLERIGSLEALERKLRDLNRQKYAAQDKMRSYNSAMTRILSKSDANEQQKFVMEAIQRIEKLKKAKFPEKEKSPSKADNVEIPVIVVNDSDLTSEESVTSKRIRTESAGNHKDETPQLSGPHLSLSFIESQKHWTLQTAEGSTSSEGQVP